MAGHKALLFLPGYGGIGCEILATVREIRIAQGDVGSWPFSNLAAPLNYVRYRGHSGRHILGLRSSLFDLKQR